MNKKNELTKATNLDMKCGNRLITFYDDCEDVTPTDVVFGDNFEPQNLLTPASLMEGDIHTPKSIKYGDYIDRIPRIVKELHENTTERDPMERERNRKRIIFEPGNNNAIEMVFETEENLLMMRKINMTYSALFVMLTNIYNDINRFDHEIAEYIRPLFTTTITPSSIYNIANYDDCRSKSDVFNRFMSHIIIELTSKANNDSLKDVIQQSLSKLLVDFVDRPLVLTYKALYKILSSNLLTYCTPNELNAIMEMVSHRVIEMQTIMMEIVVQLIEDYGYLEEDFLYKYSVYLNKIGKELLPPTEY